jgi:hypothetical protein
MKRNLAVSLFSSLAGFGLMLILLGVAGSAGAQSADVRSDGARANEASATTPLTSTFTYQGQLKNGGTAVNGSCQMVFRLYDDPAAGGLIGSPINATVPVSNGLFTVGLNFGSGAFNGSGRWLDIQVDCGGGVIALTPRQAVTAAPYSFFAASTGALQGYPVTTTAPSSGQVLKWNGSAWVPDVDAGGAAYSAGFGLTRIGSQFSVVTTTIQQRVSSTCGAGFAIRAVNADGTVTCEPVGGWGLTGNAGTNPLTNFLGTTDAQALVFKTNNAERMRVDTNGNVGIGTTTPTNKLSVNGGADFSNGTVGIGTTTPFTSSVFNSPSLQVVANSPKATVANTRALAVTTNDASNPFALDIRLNGAATLANRSAYIQTTDFNLLDGGNILLQPSTGNVGIGTTSPSNKLSVNGTADFSGNVGIGNTNPVDAKLVIQTPTGTNGFSITDGNVKLISRLNASNAEFGTLTNHDLVFTSGGFTSEVIDAAAGNLFPTCDGCSSLGKSTNRWAAVFAQNGTIQTSDARLKKSVANLNYGLSQVMQLRPVTFQWKNSSDARTHLGLIAQEVDQVVPEVVEHSDDPAAPLGMNYTALVPVLIKAVQEQQTTISKNDVEIKKLRADNDALNARLTALEQAASSRDATSHAESNTSTASWFLFGGMMVFGLIMVQKRHSGG